MVYVYRKPPQHVCTMPEDLPGTDTPNVGDVWKCCTCGKCWELRLFPLRGRQWVQVIWPQVARKKK